MCTVPGLPIDSVGIFMIWIILYVLSKLYPAPFKQFLQMQIIPEPAHRFCRQFCDQDLLELKKFSAAQFIEVQDHYNSDDKQYYIVVLAKLCPSQGFAHMMPITIYQCIFYFQYVGIVVAVWDVLSLQKIKNRSRKPTESKRNQCRACLPDVQYINCPCVR